MEQASARLNKDDWLHAALEVLASEGIQGVRVERLARDLGVTKGSFYWHFKDRDDLLAAMLDYWVEVLTVEVMELAKDFGKTPERRLLALMQYIRSRHAADFEVAVRAWGAHDTKVAEVVRRTDNLRVDYVTSLFREMGFRGRQAEMRARLFYYYEAAEPMILDDQDPEQEKRLAKMRHKFLTAH